MRRMEILSLALVPVLVGSLALLSGCGNTGLSESDKQFVETVQSGLESRYETEASDYNSLEEKWELTEEGVDAELGAISSLDLAAIENEELSNIAKEYADALQSEKEGIGYVFKNASKADKLYIDRGINAASGCLSRMKEEYGLQVDSEYDEQFEASMEKADWKFIDVGETVCSQNESGEIKLSFDGYALDPDYDPKCDKEEYGILLCRAKNVSCDGTVFEEAPGSEYVNLDGFFSMVDGSGTDIAFSSYGDNFNGYESCAGAFGDLPKGHTKKFAIRCLYMEKGQYVEAVVPGKETTYHCYMKVK